MKTSKISLFLCAMAIACSSITASAQFKAPAPSPGQTIKQAFGLGDVTIDYSRPLVKNRIIFGDLVPYGKIWRTGANGTTKLTFTEDVKLEGHDVKAGTYGLYTIPGDAAWDIMLTKDLSIAGNVANYNTDDEVVRFKVKTRALSNKVESFTIGMDAVTATTAKLQLMWDRTMVSIKLSTDIDGKMMKNIESALKADTRPYFQSANYYYDNDKDLEQALVWVNKAIEQNPAFYVVHLKAKIQLKMNDKRGAIETAKWSMKLAKEAQNDDYVRMNQKLIASAKA